MDRVGWAERLLARGDRMFGASMEADFAHAIRCRSLVVVSLLIAVLTLTYIAIIDALDHQLSTPRLVGIAGGILLSLTPVLLARSRNLTLSATLFLAVYMGIMVFGSFGTGGIHSNVVPALLVAPLAAAFFLGWARATWFVVATLAAAIALTLATNVYGLAPAHYQTPEQLAIARGVCLAFAIFGCGAPVAGLITLSRASTRRLSDARDAAEAANRLKSHFIANMSHEIRTPLNGVLGMARILARSELGEPERQYAETIETSGQALLELINDLIEISRIEAGAVPEEDDETFDIAWLVASVADRVRADAEHRGLAFEASVTPDLARHALPNARRLRRVLTVFTDNALKFTETGRVALECRYGAPGYAHFSVSDTGPGIAPEEHERIFDRFYQADRSLGRRHGGSGLGLSIAKQVVEVYGGRIGVESTPGAGARFWFEVPMAREASAARPAKLEPAAYRATAA